MEIFYTAMENTLARMILFLNTKQRMDVSIRWACPDCIQSSLWMDEDLLVLENFMIFTASPAYSLASGRHPDCDGMISCDAYIYHILKEENGVNTCGLKITRMDVGFENRGGKAVIQSIHWYTVQDMEPWIYACDPGFSGMEMDVPFETISEPVPSEIFCAVKKQINRIWDRLEINSDEKIKNIFQVAGNRIGAAGDTPWAAGGSELSLAGPAIGLTASPAVWMNGEEQVQAWYPAELFCLAGAPEGHQVVCRCFYYVYCTFVRDRGGWRRTTQWATLFLRLPDTPYHRGKHYDKISADMLPWTLENESMPGNYPEDSYAIENIINGWVYGCRRGRLCEFYETYMKNCGFTPEMWIKSQGEKTPKLGGEKEILHKLSEMDANYHPGMYTFHTAATPLIEISADGQSATGTWFDHSATNLSGGDSGAERIPYMVFVARYRHHFQKIDGTWYLTDFFWEPLISLDDWIFDRKHSAGQAVRENAGLYPEAFSLDIYSCK